MPKLVLLIRDGEETHPLTEPKITVGRMADNALVIDDPSVSSHHAELVLDDGDYLLRDLGSTNGTRLNGETIKEGKLRDGDRVRFGKVEADYRSEVAVGLDRPMPVLESLDARPASSSMRPTDFGNASPFKGKGKRKDPAGRAVFAVAGVALLAFAAAMASVFLLMASS